MATVHHGIDLDQFEFSPRVGNYLAYLGRISPEKGLHSAIAIARQAGLPLQIAARMPLPFQSDLNVRADWEYWEHTIKPLLGKEVELVGEVAGARKAAFLANAAALLFPIAWPEPFGLVMAEALACGTPVLASRHGSVPEVIRDGITGYVRDTEDELITAVGQLEALDRHICRQEAECRFSPAAMAEAYERVYERLTFIAHRSTMFELGRLTPQSMPRKPGDTASIAPAATAACQVSVSVHPYGIPMEDGRDAAAFADVRR